MNYGQSRGVEVLWTCETPLPFLQLPVYAAGDLGDGGCSVCWEGLEIGVE